MFARRVSAGSQRSVTVTGRVTHAPVQRGAEGRSVRTLWNHLVLTKLAGVSYKIMKLNI